MNLLCGALKNLWNEFYIKYVKGLDDKTKVMVGTVCLILSLFIFVVSTKGPDKAKMIQSWFLFWVSLVLMIAAVFYLSIA